VPIKNKLKRMTKSDTSERILDHLVVCKKLASSADMKFLLFIIEMAILETSKTKQ